MITIENLTFAYGKMAPVLQDFSLDFQQGNIYGLLGKNGTGKSTLLYLIMGLLHAQKGEALVDGMSAKDRNPELMRKMFLLPEEYDLPAVPLSAFAGMSFLYFLTALSFASPMIMGVASGNFLASTFSLIPTTFTLEERNATASASALLAPTR